MTIRVGLTGGIGSGKTMVSKEFERLGIPVIDTDRIAHELTAPHSLLLARIADEFGPGVVRDGVLNRDALRQQVFADKAQRRRLEAILHPVIRDEVDRLAAQSDADYCIIVVPLLVEARFQDLVDRVLVVTAPKLKRIQWLKRRSGLSEPEIDRIMSAQATDAERLSVADDRIDNDGGLSALTAQVERLHQSYLALAAATGWPASCTKDPG